ncbi:MAG: pilus assembly protein PilN [Methylobacter sp.]|nr:MAG: pilus assembly protein PilN [Methylobacter sp.]PPD04094.1 MAG: pilus assembly protein PilN [Methylobacter sp.]PPD19959.1 MAG: pilus assembly protein PilN [Methylobacter sp.]PPD34646.1 MAG: pilus assembly protein PilN [Methylomonas sp.]
MVKINLLPWREELRKQKKQDFIAMIGLAVLATLAVLAVVHLYIVSLKDYQDRRNKMLQDEMVLLDKRIQEIKTIEEKKAKLLAKIDLIQKLQESRPEIVHLFDEVAKVTPEGIFLTKFTQTGTALTFDGKSESNARISGFMRTIEASPWLQAPKLEVINSPSKASANALSDFTLRAAQRKRNADANKGGKQ